MQAQTYKFRYDYLPNGANYLKHYMLIPFSISSLTVSSNVSLQLCWGILLIFQPLISIWCYKFIFFCRPVIYQEDVILVLHIYVILLLGFFYPEGSFWQHYPVLLSSYVFLISIQKQHSNVEFVVKSLCCLMYHQHIYTP